MRALNVDIRFLQASRVPVSLRGLVGVLIDQLRVLLRQAQPPTMITPTTLARWRAELSRDFEAAYYPEHLIRRSLGLPEQVS